MPRSWGQQCRGTPAGSAWAPAGPLTPHPGCLLHPTPPPADEHGHATKRRVTEGADAGSTSPGSSQQLPPVAESKGVPAPPAAQPPAPAVNPALAALQQQATTGGGSSENGRSTHMGASHDTERLVDAMMSDAAGKVVQ